MIDFFRRALQSALKGRYEPMPPTWIPILKRHARFYEGLSDAEREVFDSMLVRFVRGKVFIGAGGLEITDEVRVVIAAQAVRLVLYLDLSYYKRLHEIVVYPYDFLTRDEEARCGEVDDWNVVVLSWPSVLEGAHKVEDGFNPTLHEFAHVLDRATGSFDGTPVLRKRSHYESWSKVMSRHFLRLKKGKTAQTSVLDDYGAENEAEFFAVATEAFFEQTREMKQTLPDLFVELKRFYGYEPLVGGRDQSPAQSSRSGLAS